MFGIGDYFSRIKNSFTREILLRKAICDSLKEVVGVDVPMEALKFNAGTVNLVGVSSELKSTIFIRKQAILAKIFEKQKIRAITDIR